LRRCSEEGDGGGVDLHRRGRGRGRRIHLRFLQRQWWRSSLKRRRRKASGGLKTMLVTAMPSWGLHRGVGTWATFTGTGAGMPRGDVAWGLHRGVGGDIRGDGGGHAAGGGGATKMVYTMLLIVVKIWAGSDGPVRSTKKARSRHSTARNN
jgi:hypothetical protein